MSEVINITVQTDITRTVAANTVVTAMSTPPTDGSIWNQTFSLVYWRTASPDNKFYANGCTETVITLKLAGEYRITMTPTTTPFVGTLQIG